jgi:predicted PurR-regulated permease PerM
VILIGSLIALPALVIPPLAEQISGLNVDILRLLDQLQGFLGREFIFGSSIIDGAAIFEQFVAVIQDLLQPLFGHTLGIAFEIIYSMVWIIFILIVSFYLVKDSSSIRKWFEEIPPQNYRQDVIRLRNDIQSIWKAFFSGQLILGSIVALILSIIGLVIGLPSALALGILGGLLEFLPSIGHGIWLATASGVALFVGSVWMPLPNWIFALILIGIHLVFQQFDLNYLIPRIIGRKVHLSPLVVILGIVAGASIAGVLGIVLAAPTIASARVIGRYIFSNLFDMDPFPEKVIPQMASPDPRWWDFRRGKENRNEEEEVS